LSNFKRGKKTGLPTGNFVVPSKVKTSTQEEMGLIYKQECARYSHKGEKFERENETRIAFDEHLILVFEFDSAWI
ncbi:hypothetical protein AVEN_271665-1, partial [Araneus ventricosus]